MELWKFTKPGNFFSIPNFIVSYISFMFKVFEGRQHCRSAFAAGRRGESRAHQGLL
jgi:hypothetical protein